MNWINTILKTCLFIGVTLLCQSCLSSSSDFEPRITYTPSEQLVKTLPTPFAPLTKNELQAAWGRELYVGSRFAEERDFYRAVTSFKTALFLLPSKEEGRRHQLEFYIMLSYYFAQRYQDTVNYFTESTLNSIPQGFPALRELRLMLYDSYLKLEQCEKALEYRAALDDATLSQITLSEALLSADFEALQCYEDRPAVQNLLSQYQASQLNPRKAAELQAVLPGMGYYYVGLKKAALTSFIINALFIGATYELFHHGYPAAALITLSLETGWYFGGINGAKLAATQYNEVLYEGIAKETLVQEKLFPVLMFQYAF